MSRPIGPYAPVRRAGDWLVTSGQLGVAPGGSGEPQLVPGGAPAELRQALANLAALLAGESAGLSQVVKATVYLTDIGDYPAVNEVWSEGFGAHRPARSVVAVVALPMGARVEVEAWAHVIGIPPGR